MIFPLKQTCHSQTVGRGGVPHLGKIPTFSRFFWRRPLSFQFKLLSNQKIAHLHFYLNFQTCLSIHSNIHDICDCLLLPFKADIHGNQNWKSAQGRIPNDFFIFFLILSVIVIGDDDVDYVFGVSMMTILTLWPIFKSLEPIRWFPFLWWCWSILCVVISLLGEWSWQSRFHAREQRPTKLISQEQVGNIEMQNKNRIYKKNE